MNLFFHRQNKELIVTIHGFGSKGKQEMAPLAAFLKKNGYDVITFDIFNPKDPQDISVREWIGRCEKEMKKAFEKSDNVVLIGFSMGGVIASYLATVFPVKRLILCAPAFSYMDFSKIEQVGKGLLSSGSSEHEMTLSQKQAFMNLVSKYRSSITLVDCPVLILHGTSDEVIPPKSSRKAFYSIPHEHKHLIYLEGGKHRFLYDGKLEPAAFSIILDFLQKKF